MNIIILNDFGYVNGGAGQIALETAMSLARSGIHTHLFVGMGPIAKELISQKNLQVTCLDQYDILSDPNRVRAIYQGWWNLKAARCLSHILGGYNKNSTIIHVHTCQKVLSSSCIHAAKKLGFKVIYHLHDYGIICPNSGLYNYQSREICVRQAMGLQCILSNCDSRHYVHKLWRCVRQFIQNNISKMLKHMDGYIAVSEFSYHIMKPYLSPFAKVKVISNPCPMNVSKRVLAEKNTVFIFIGRLSPEKNPVLLAKCARNIGAPVMFIGDGIEKEEIKKENPDAVLCGWIPREELYTEIHKARCLVFPSVWYETQGLVVQEMSAYGIPAIVSDVSAASEYIIDRYNGFIFKSNSEESLTMCMTKMLDDALVEKMGKNTFVTFHSKENTEKKYIQKLLEFYKEVLKG